MAMYDLRTHYFKAVTINANEFQFENMLDTLPRTNRDNRFTIC